MSPIPRWRADGLRYFPLNYHLRTKFGGRVQKISLDLGATCPNVDGTVAVGGCTFCDNRSFSPSRRSPRQSISRQIEAGIARTRARYRCDRFLAYFQPGTNTYAPVDRLREAYEQARAHPDIVGIVVGTRPDCVPDSVLDLLEDLARQIHVCLEFGIQTIHNRSLEWINRGHHYEVVPDAVRRSRGRGFEIGAHVILGFPGESASDMRETAREIARLNINAIKLHNLYAVKNTPLAEQVDGGEVALMDLEEYVTACADFLELLPASMVIERICGDAPPRFLVGPQWCLDKSKVRRALLAELDRRDSWQGKYYNRSRASRKVIQ